MNRARGRRSPTRPGGFDPGPDSPEGREIGESERQDPDGWINAQTGNIVHHEVPRQEVQSAEPMDQFRGMMAHGVPHEADTTEERATAVRGGPNVRRIPRIQAEESRPQPPAVPVYLVEQAGGPGVIRSASPRHITVPANTGADPVRICGRATNRVRIGLLNEDTATNIRFARSIGDLTNGGGALLPWPTNSYSWFETQDELYAVTVSASLSVVMSVIEEFEQEL